MGLRNVNRGVSDGVGLVFLPPSHKRRTTLSVLLQITGVGLMSLTSREDGRGQGQERPEVAW